MNIRFETQNSYLVLNSLHNYVNIHAYSILLVVVQSIVLMSLGLSEQSQIVDSR